MNISKFTQKSMEAVQNCERLAYEYGNQQIEQEHLFYSLLSLEDSLILKLLTKMEVGKELILNEAESFRSFQRSAAAVRFILVVT